jgi:hypothetical protein
MPKEMGAPDRWTDRTNAPFASNTLRFFHNDAGDDVLHEKNAQRRRAIVARRRCGMDVVSVRGLRKAPVLRGVIRSARAMLAALRSGTGMGSRRSPYRS